METFVHPGAGSISNNYMKSDDSSIEIPAVYEFHASFEDTLSSMSNYRWNEKDIILATYPKNGTSFTWEIMTMLLRGSAEYQKEQKTTTMIDIATFDEIDVQFPSPRVLNTHYRLDVLPAEFRDRKTVVAMRNPKDTCVSYYYHETKLMSQVKGGIFAIKDVTLSDYVKMFLYNKDVPYGSYFDYIEYMWSLRNNPNILIVFFEDLKLDPVSTIQKVNEFMGTDRSPDLVQQIAMATSFNKMKPGKIEKVTATKEGSAEKSVLDHLYRKGEVGDWKRHLTVADNELFDSFLQNWKVGQEIPFKYA